MNKMLLISWLAACGGCGATAPDMPARTPTFTPTPPGVPTGTAVTQTVDTAGATVASADGRLLITFPAGALPASTAITIQPISNTAPNGVGDAYRLSPEGTTFVAPVTLTLRSSPEQIAGARVATRHGDGLWYSQGPRTIDAGAGTVSVTTTHFSDWALLQTILLDPAASTVKPNEEITLNAFIVDPDRYTTLEESGEAPCPDKGPLTGDDLVSTDLEWAVNGEPHGGPTFGHVQGPTPSAATQAHAAYDAPGTTPNPDTVTVSLTVTTDDNQRVTAVATVKIQGTPESWRGTSSMTYPDGTTLSASFTFARLPGDTGAIEHLAIASGTVTVKPPTMTSAGCLLDISPTTMTIAGGEGQLTVDTTDPQKFLFTGAGTTVWPATYTVTCPGQSPGTLQSAEAGYWWPIGTGGPTTVEGTHEGMTGQVSSPLASGTVQLQPANLP